MPYDFTGGYGTPVASEAVEAKIREVNDAVQMLRGLTRKAFSELTVYERLSMRYLLIQLVEAASGICAHVLLGVFHETPEGFPECFARLGVKGVIPEELASRLVAEARLRNLLVHRYWVVDDEKVYESVKRGLEDFEGFTIHVRMFLEGKRV